jgi:hypothetical protein
MLLIVRLATIWMDGGARASAHVNGVKGLFDMWLPHSGCCSIPQEQQALPIPPTWYPAAVLVGLNGLPYLRRYWQSANRLIRSVSQFVARLHPRGRSCCWQRSAWRQMMGQPEQRCDTVGVRPIWLGKSSSWQWCASGIRHHSKWTNNASPQTPSGTKSGLRVI